MKKIIFASLFSLFLFGCAADDAVVSTNPKPSKINEPVISPTMEEVLDLSLEERVGQMILTGFHGTEVNEELSNALTNDYIGNVILFSRNITSIEQTKNMNKEILSLNNEIPIWISLDEEGGDVSRMPSEVVTLPSARTLAKNYTSDEVEGISSHLSILLNSIGFSVDFAPVMDINSNPNNPVIGSRAFSNDASVVSEYSTAFNNGLRSHNVIGSAKHFPGHGDTDVDSHHTLPIIDKNLDELYELELAPFKHAIQNNIDMIMVAHLLIPSIDDTYPASQSRKIMTDLLREEMNYNGLIITDDLFMNALGSSVSESAVNAVIAGADIALVGQSIEEAILSKHAILQAVEDGRLSEQQLNQSVERILNAKKEYFAQIDDSFNLSSWNAKMNFLLKK